MKVTALYLFVTMASMLLCICDGAEIRVKRSDSEVDSNLDSDGLCKTERTWLNDCNRCWCTEGHVPACTLKGCIHIPDLKIKEAIIKNEEETAENVAMSKSETMSDAKCIPDAKWMEDCNSCFCTDDGLSACTEIGCVSLVEKEQN